MKIRYEETIDEAVQTQLYLLKKSSVAKRLKWRFLIYSTLLLISLYFVILKRHYALSPVIVGCLAALTYLAIYIKGGKKRIRKFMIKHLETEEPIPSEYELSEDGCIFRQVGQETRFKWDYVEELIENDNDIVMRIARGGIAVIPKRIFFSDEQRNSWLKFIHNKTGII